MKLHNHHPSLARKIANHELAHYVIARAMGFKTGGVRLKLIGLDGHDGAATIILHEPLGSHQALINYLERRVIVLFAGALGETLTPQHIPHRGVNCQEAERILLLEKGAAQDLAKARELVWLMGNLNFSAAAPDAEIQAKTEEIHQRLWARTAELVERFEELIVGVGESLAQRVRRLEEEVALTAEHLEALPSIRNIPVIEP